jgi:hypothetical protein
MKSTIRFLLVLVLVMVLVLAVFTARPYGGLYTTPNAGFVWSFGGVEISPSFGLFLCSGGISNFIDNLFMNYVADC